MRILHYSTPNGREPVKEFVAELPAESRFEVLVLLRRIEAGEVLPLPHSRSMSSVTQGLYELRVRDVQGQIRVFYYTKLRGVIYLIHALRKKSRTISNKERDVILKRIKELHSAEKR
jgi:phage-related protein